MDQTLTNKKFIEQMDNVITKLGGTPIDLELTEDQEDDMVLNGVFASKIDEVIKALGGTPAEISVAENNMVSNGAFQVKMEDVVENMESGDGGGNGYRYTINFTSENTFTFGSDAPADPVADWQAHAHEPYVVKSTTSFTSNFSSVYVLLAKNDKIYVLPTGEGIDDEDNTITIAVLNVDTGTWYSQIYARAVD